jgi:hypothetical protein
MQKRDGVRCRSCYALGIGIGKICDLAVVGGRARALEITDMTIGRNDPCHCGSGRKFKQCCLQGLNSASLTVRRLREAEGRVIPLMWDIALRTWKQEGLDEAYATFFMDTPVTDDIQAHPDHESLFLTWLGLGFAPTARRGARGRPAAIRLLEEGHAAAGR